MASKVYVHLILQNVILFRIRVFADVIKHIEMKSSWIRVSPKSNVSPYKKQEEEKETRRGECHLTMELKIRVMYS